MIGADVKNVNYEELIAAETKRYSEQYGKAFLNCAEIGELTGLGRDNVRALIKSKVLPVKLAGRRKIVSIADFVIWQFNK